MEPVTATRTSTDAGLEQRQIREANALLVQQRDTILREISQWQPVLYTIRAECAAHTDLPTLRNKITESISIHLLERKDILQREIDEKEARKGDLTLRVSQLDQQAIEKEGALAAKTTQLEGLKTETAQWEEKGRSAQTAHQSAKEGMEKELGELVPQVEQARNHLAGVKLEEEVLLQNRQAEEIRLSTKSRDLAIYEGRIREAAAQLNPPMQINL